MELTGLGGGVMLAIAAVLWLAYLLPNWFKQREYLATEKNAVRLQQTIRVLAETTVVQSSEPRPRPQVEPGPVAVGRAVNVQPTIKRDPVALAAARVRRSRVLATVVLLGSLVVAVVQVVMMANLGVVPGAWFVLVGSAVAAAASIALLRRLAAVSRSRHQPSQGVEKRTQPLRDYQPVPQATAERAKDASWTPVQTPKPLYLSRSTATPVVPSAESSTAELERAAAAAERALRSQERLPSIQPKPSRFASMGIVDAADAPATASPDIDAVLARRRAAG